MLASFEVEGFRTFKHLKIDRLARVNLVVGRNNVGKTMLLEALRLYVGGANASALGRLLHDREEVLPIAMSATAEDDALFRVESLLHGRPHKAHEPGQIRLREPDVPGRALNIDIDVVHHSIVVDRAAESSAGEGWSALSEWRRRQQDRPPLLSAEGLTAAQAGRFWDGLALRSGEDRVLRCLRIIAPVERLTLIQNPMRPQERIVVARVAGEAQPVPLRSLGDGMVRVLHLALAVEQAHAGDDLQLDAIDEPVLLVDEIETGIHFAALPDVWRFVFQAARERDLQVFATTHSWDCIEAFQQAAADEPVGSAELIRLEQKGDEHRAVIFDQDELPIITKRHIEVR